MVPVLGNVLLCTVIILLLYASLEWAFPRYFNRLFPIDAMQKFDEPNGMWPLLQSSKRGFFPEDYIALAGDSYAMGMGDEMMSGPERYRPRFHSAHILQDMTGKDVISYGFPGSGSIRGLISNLIGGQQYIRKMFDENFPPPRWVLLYFYEGNDLSENWMYFDKTFPQAYAGQDYDDVQVFDRYVQDVALGRHHLYQAANAATFRDRLFFWKYTYRFFAENILKKKFYRKKYPDEFGLIYLPPDVWTPRVVTDPVNKALVAGKVQSLPDNLQGPSLDLSPEQLQHAVGTFSKSLDYARRHFPETRFAVIYIPSVLSVYSIAGDKIHAQNYFGTGNIFDKKQLEERHNWIRGQIALACTVQQVPFIDTTDDLRKAGTQALIHGPKDWNHLSKQGYDVLGESVGRQMQPVWVDYIGHTR
ncbi:MAG TPA: hypothetical protein PLF22_09280 [Pseudomonadales bacterium]|nr:hypothetical protein [Pseudomonadales bacterium]